MFSVGKYLFKNEGIRGLYKGGTPLFIGGTAFRSAQFGVNDIALTWIRSRRDNPDQPIAKSDRLFGIIDYEVVGAGFCGGIGRGVVEAPFEYVKVRKQVDHSWKLKNVYNGSQITILRNSFLFMFFMLYIDLGKRLTNDKMTPFLTGAVCANLAWISVWPLDIVKSQYQSGNFKGKSGSSLFKEVFRSGRMFRGVIPGLTRSSIANGCSMTVFVYVKETLSKMNAENI